MRRLFRLYQPPKELESKNDGDIRQRRIEITVERETVTVLHSGGRQTTKVDREQATKTEPNRNSV